jgi:hypothetical protein
MYLGANLAPSLLKKLPSDFFHVILVSVFSFWNCVLLALPAAKMCFNSTFSFVIFWRDFRQFLVKNGVFLLKNQFHNVVFYYNSSILSETRHFCAIFSAKIFSIITYIGSSRYPFFTYT